MNKGDLMKELLNEIYRYLIPALCIIIAAYCVKHLLSSRAPKVTPAYFYDEQNGKEYVITNWETSIGRSIQFKFLEKGEESYENKKNCCVPAGIHDGAGIWYRG